VDGRVDQTAAVDTETYGRRLLAIPVLIGSHETRRWRETDANFRSLEVRSRGRRPMMTKSVKAFVI
jgi:hypothetical protein